MPTATTHLTKTVPVRIIETKAVEGADGRPQGIVRALFSVYDVEDFDGDVTRKGSFDPLIERFKAGERIPYVFAHNSWDLDGYLGVITDVAETTDGPELTAQLFLDDPQGAKAFRLLESGAVTQHSYQYEVLESHIETDAEGKTVQVLDQLQVFEAGPCLRGANPETMVVDAKGQKAGRVLSAANESSLRSAIEKITGGIADLNAVLDQLMVEPKSAGDAPAPATEDPAEGNEATPHVDAKSADGPLLAEAAALLRLT